MSAEISRSANLSPISAPGRAAHPSGPPPRSSANYSVHAPGALQPSQSAGAGACISSLAPPEHFSKSERLFFSCYKARWAALLHRVLKEMWHYNVACSHQMIRKKRFNTLKRTGPWRFFFPTAQVHSAPPGAKVYRDICVLGKPVTGWFMPADPRTTQPPHLGAAGSSWLLLAPPWHLG